MFKMFAPLTPSQVTNLVADMQTKSFETRSDTYTCIKMNASSPHLYNNSHYQHLT